MKSKIIAIIFILISSYSFACDCEWGGNFIYASKSSELIIKGKVIEKLYNFEDKKIINESSEAELEHYLIQKNQEFIISIKVEIIELIKGKEKKKTIEIFGSDGSDCRAATHDFKKDDIYIFSLFKTIKSEYNQPNENDYYIDGCSENILQFVPEHNEVYGVIKGKLSSGKNRKYSYEKLKSKISKP